jgi:chromosome segregation ATPase
MSKTQESPLVEAARALEGELERFAKIARELEKEPLSSRKSLDRAGGQLAKIADLEQSLGPAMGALMSALNGLRERHEAQGESIKRRAEEIRERAVVFQELMDRLAELVERTSALNASLGGITNGDRGKDELIAELDRVLEQLGELTGATDLLKRDARERSFDDLAKQAESHSDQLDAVRSKLARFKKEFSK